MDPIGNISASNKLWGYSTEYSLGLNEFNELYHLLLKTILLFTCVMFFLTFLVLMSLVLSGRSSFLGENYEKKLIIVPYAGTNEEEYEVTETELLRLLEEKPLEPLDETEKPKVLDDLKGIVNKYLKITEVEIHQSSMYSATNATKVFHAFNVFRTTSESDGDYWWSLEKNLDYIVLQRSRNKDDVKNKLQGIKREEVKPYVENLDGKGSIKDLLKKILDLKVIPESYNIVGSNCQSLVSFVSKQITKVGFKYKAWDSYFIFFFCKFERYENIVEELQFINSLTGETEWPTLFSLVNLENTDDIDKVIKSGNCYINALHGGITPLHFATMLNKTEMVKHLLKDPIIDPTTRDTQFGMNALHWAVAVLNTEETEIIDLLLAHPIVKVDDVDGDGQTALHWAARESDVMAVEKLLEKGANPNVRHKEGLTPLHVAAYFGKRTKIIDLILQAQNHNHVDDDKSENGATALHYAAASSNEIIAQHLINKGADLHSRDNDGDTPLHEAAFHAKDMKIFDFFLRKTKDTDMLFQYRNDVKLLYYAYRNKNLLGAKIAARLKAINRGKLRSLAAQILQVLRFVIEIPAKLLLLVKEFTNSFTNSSSYLKKLDRLQIERAKNSQEIDEILEKEKFDINSRDYNGETPLFCAIRANNVNAVGRLLEKGADPTKRNYNGLTPFQVAATENKDLEILDLLLEYKDVDINDGKYGYTLLHLAMATSNVTAVDFLLSKGANPNVTDQNGTTPLHVAAYCADTTDVLDLILETKKVDINGRDKDGQTALHYAVRSNRVDNVRYLLEKGADPAISDENGLTPYRVAAAAVSQELKILDLLRPNENKTEIGEGNNAEDLDNVELPPQSGRLRQCQLLGQQRSTARHPGAK